ncbi:hypothetical protein BC332_11636 [Capsicum chinense]|nr:hypothetical protein BC332_11636 [Capsicum chinense]
MEQCTCMVDLLGRAGQLLEAYEFIENMPIGPDANVWGALLGACKIHGNLEMAEYVADWLKFLLDELEAEKIPGKSSVEINRHIHTFLVGAKDLKLLKSSTP